MFGIGVAHLVVLVVGGLIAGTAYGAWRRRAHSEGEATLYPPADVTRLTLASLVLNGPVLRGQILRRLSNPFRALAPEPGVDFPLVMAAAKRFDDEEQAYWWAIAIATVVYLLLPKAAPWFFLFVVVLVAVSLHRRWKIRFKLASRFRRANYDPAALRRELGVIDPPSEVQEAVICHGTADPFVGLGLNQGGWNLAFDVRRPAPGQSMVKGEVDARGMDEAISRAIRRLAVPGLEIDEPMFVNGAQSLAVGLHADPYSRPAARLNEADLARYRHGADPSARVYRRVVVTDWSGELVLSYLFRCLRRGDVLVVETAQLVLTPVDGQYRQIDTLRDLGLLGQVAWWARSVALIPFDVIQAFAFVVRRSADVLDEAVFGGVEGRERREIKANPAYNYGALWSLRSHVASKSYASYFQKADAFQYFRAIDEQVLNAIRDCLDANGIDSTAMSAQAVSIQNNTVQISGARDVNLSGVAVGAAATAQVAKGRRNPIAGGGRS